MAALVKDISLAASTQLEERKGIQRDSGNRKFSLSKRRERGASLGGALMAVPICLPSLLMMGLVVSQAIESSRFSSKRLARLEDSYLQATEEANNAAIELILLKRLNLSESALNTNRSRYIKMLVDAGRFEEARRFVRSIPFDGSERTGELQLTAALALSKAGITDDASKREFESRLVIAVADPVTSDRARAQLGRFFRQTGQFRASESILEPIRATEQGCLELALLRYAQGQFSDIPTTLAPYLVRWRERWLAPKSQADIESSAEPLILMNQESIVLETLDNPPVPVAPDVAEKIRIEAAKTLIDREFRSGTLRLWNALEEIERHYDRLPCSEIWIEPILKLSSQNSPTRDRAILQRDRMAFGKPCPASFLNAFARKAIDFGEFAFAEKLLESIRSGSPEDFDSRETLARLLLEKKAKDDERLANLAKASDLVDSVLSESPDRPAAIAIRGRIREEKGQLTEALKDLRTAVEADPRNVGLHEAIARVSSKCGQPDLARIHEELARELKPKE